MKRVLNEMHCRELVIAYGQTETSPVVTMSDADDTIEIRVNTVGRAMPQTEIQIVSTETGEPLPIGAQGEVCVHGYALMKGYDGDPEGTAQVIHTDGWLHTGDLGIMHDDGCIHLTGRSRDVIIRGGENIYPREVEEFLYTHPKVDEVQVVGIPNARLGEIVAAWVRLRPGSRSHRRRDQAVVPGPDRLLQDPRTRPLRHRVPRHAKRQNPEIQDSRV